VLGVTGIDHHDLESALFQDLEDRNPIDPGRLHDDRPDPASGEPIRQPSQVVGEGSKRPDRLFVAIRTDGRNMHGGANIDCRRG
jgi:hypothetical protein